MLCFYGSLRSYRTCNIHVQYLLHSSLSFGSQCMLCRVEGDKKAEEAVDERLLIPFHQFSRCDNTVPSRERSCASATKNDIGINRFVK